MKNKSSIIIFLILAIGIISCEKDENHTALINEDLMSRNSNELAIDNVEDQYIYGLDKSDQARFRFSKALALALSNMEIRDFIKTQVLLQNEKGFDTEVLYIRIKDLIIEKNKKFSDVLESFDPIKGDNFFQDEITKLDPYLTILVFMNFQYELEDWDILEEIPNVGIWYSSNNRPEIIPICNSEGDIKAQYANVLPEKVIIGTKHNETHLILDLDDKKSRGDNDLSTIIGDNYCHELLEELNTNQNVFHLPNSEIIISEQYLLQLYDRLCVRQDPDDGDDDECERDYRNTKDIVFQYELSGVGAWDFLHDSWGEGWKLEVKNFTTFGQLEADGLLGVKTFHNPDIPRHFSDYFAFHPNFFFVPVIDGTKEIVINWILRQWLPEINGLICESRWIEIDKIDTEHQFEFNLGYKAPSQNGGLEASIKYKLRYDPSDDIMGVSYPEYCDKADYPGFSYSLGSIATFNQGHMDD